MDALASASVLYREGDFVVNKDKDKQAIKLIVVSSAVKLLLTSQEYDAFCLYMTSKSVFFVRSDLMW